jgi:hypothetical protein
MNDSFIHEITSGATLEQTFLPRFRGNLETSQADVRVGRYHETQLFSSAEENRKRMQNKDQELTNVESENEYEKPYLYACVYYAYGDYRPSGNQC